MQRQNAYKYVAYVYLLIKSWVIQLLNETQIISRLFKLILFRLGDKWIRDRKMSQYRPTLTSQTLIFEEQWQRDGWRSNRR